MPVTAGNKSHRANRPAVCTALASEKRSAFTLLELLVSMVVLSLLVVLIATMIDTTSRATRRPLEQAQTFREARTAFELLTRRLSQATLNTYWDYDDPNAPTVYQRRSELHFVTGPTATLLGTTPAQTPGQAVFFQAPLGLVDTTALRVLPNLLNACGFFVRFDSDSAAIPDFLTNTLNVQPKFRYRAYQWVQPAEKLAIYSNAGYSWFTGSISADPATLRPIAQNVIALIFHPRLSEREDQSGTALSTDFRYDSRSATAPAATINQLPPQVDVVLVAIDEASAARLANGSTPPDFGLAGLFTNASATAFAADLQTLENNMNNLKANYRIFHTTVKIPGAKWSGY